MPPFGHYAESFLGLALTLSKGHDAQLLSLTSPYLKARDQTVTITSSELGASSPGRFTAGKHVLLGGNLFPQLAWHTTAENASAVKSWLLLVEDPDSPMPAPGVHGIYYDIPARKTSVSSQDFKPSDDGATANALMGGFKFGQNRRGSVWIGPRPVISHGSHRYFFIVVGLSTVQVESTAPVSKEALDGPAGLLKDQVVCWGEYVASFERTLWTQ